MFEWLRNRKVLISIAAIVLCILLIVKLGLYVNLILGNDVGISLAASELDIALVHGESETVEFETRITTNPFCEASCTSRFEDLGANTTLGTEAFAITRGLPSRQSYTIKATKRGDGQELYRMTIICQSHKSMLCHTEERPVQRSVLITMEYNLTETEQRDKERLAANLSSFIRALGDLEGEIAGTNTSISTLDRYYVMDSERAKIRTLANATAKLEQGLPALIRLWEQQDYQALSAEYGAMVQRLQALSADASALRNGMEKKARLMNEVALRFFAAEQTLNRTRSLYIGDAMLAREVNDSIRSFNLDSRRFLQRTATKGYNESFDDLYGMVLQDQYDFALLKFAEADLWYVLLCRRNVTCVERPEMTERARETDSDIMRSCGDIEPVRRLGQNLTNLSEIWSSVVDEQLSRLPDTRQAALIIARFQNSTPTIPKRCRPYNVVTLNRFLFEPVRLTAGEPRSINMTFPEPLPRCCALGSCEPCCTGESCRSDPATYPVIFLHGHAVSKDTPFDFSLDGFQWLQTRLESDGFIDAGSLSTYAAEEQRRGSWGLSNSPVSVKASYYFDTYENSDDTTLVQIKSENIDTYAIRLDETVKLVRQYTGKPKVRIIAHSMGGLVARRYLQVFGSGEVEQLIMIGTPNHGINGTVRRMCPVTGSTLECRDMDSDSLFLNKLNRAGLPKIDIVNIVGQGCRMDYGDGDGIVEAESAQLGKNNRFVNGTCEGKYLHSKLLHDENVYKIVRDSLLG